VELKRERTTDELIVGAKEGTEEGRNEGGEE
jgi:hypothetical protein